MRVAKLGGMVNRGLGMHPTLKCHAVLWNFCPKLVMAHQTSQELMEMLGFSFSFIVASINANKQYLVKKIILYIKIPD